MPSVLSLTAAWLSSKACRAGPISVFACTAPGFPDPCCGGNEVFVDDFFFALPALGAGFEDAAGFNFSLDLVFAVAFFGKRFDLAICTR